MLHLVHRHAQDQTIDGRDAIEGPILQERRDDLVGLRGMIERPQNEISHERALVAGSRAGQRVVERRLRVVLSDVDAKQSLQCEFARLTPGHDPSGPGAAPPSGPGAAPPSGPGAAPPSGAIAARSGRKSIETPPARKRSSRMIERQMSSVVLTPSMRVSANAPAMRAIVSSRVAPWAITFASNES